MTLIPCLNILRRVFKHHESLTACFNTTSLTPEQKAVCYGVMRWYIQLDFILAELLHEPIKEKNLVVTLYLYIGLFQILAADRPPYAIVTEIVAQIKQSKFRWAAALANKVLRKFSDELDTIRQHIATNQVASYAHPQWMCARMSLETLEANNQQAPMTLRVNALQTTRGEYIKKLRAAGIQAQVLTSSPNAIQLDQPVSVQQLPDFALGACSVQDEAGQLIAAKLVLKPGLRVLDACAAPGSKTCHILEAEPYLQQLVAIDIDATRLQKITDNIQRLQLSPTNVSLIATDALAVKTWWDGKPFDRILIDAPCSASGVIRRHPDIKLLRRESDLADLQHRQLQLLLALSPLLHQDGLLIYSTCSVFREENSAVIEQFIEKSGFVLREEQQLFPQKNGHDGFYISTLTCFYNTHAPTFII